MLNSPATIVNITHRSKSVQSVPICEICGSLTNKKAFRSSLLWKAFSPRNIAFSGQLHLIPYNNDNRNVHNNLHNRIHAKTAKIQIHPNRLFDHYQDLI